MLKRMGNKILQFYAKKACLSKSVSKLITPHVSTVNNPILNSSVKYITGLCFSVNIKIYRKESPDPGDLRPRHSHLNSVIYV